MGAVAFQITSVSIVCSTVDSGADQKKTSKLRVTGLCVGIHRWPVNSPHKWPVTRKMFPFNDVIMHCNRCNQYFISWIFPERHTCVSSNYSFRHHRKWTWITEQPHLSPKSFNISYPENIFCNNSAASRKSTYIIYIRLKNMMLNIQQDQHDHWKIYHISMPLLVCGGVDPDDNYA